MPFGRASNLAIRKSSDTALDADGPKDSTTSSSHAAGDALQHALHQARRKTRARDTRSTAMTELIDGWGLSAGLSS
jgi:hypothetical protein